MPRKATGSGVRHDGKLWAIVTIPGTNKRKWVPCPESITDEDGAKRYAAFLTRQVRAGALVLDDPTVEASAPGESFAAWSERWLSARKTKGLASVKDDESRLRVHILPVLGDKLMAKIQPPDLEAFVAQLDAKVQRGQMSWKTARNIWGLVSKAFKDAKGSKLRELRVRRDNPALDVAPPDAGADKAKTYLYPSEFLALLRCERVPVRWRRLIALSIYLYPRAGELEALQCESVDLEHGVVDIHQAMDRYRDIGKVKSTKTGVSRRVPVEPALRGLLRTLWREAGGTGPLVKMPPAEDMPERLRQYLRWAGVTRAALHVDAGDRTRKRIGWHDLRATGITWRAVRGDDPLKIQRAAGHSNLETTQGYIREAEALVAGFGEVFPELPPALLAIEVDAVR